MKLRMLEKVALGNPVRDAFLRWVEVPRLLRRIPRMTGSKVLEIGPGFGGGSMVITRRLRCRIVGVDLDESLLKRARRRLHRTVKSVAREPVVTFVGGDTTRLPFRDECFDAVVQLYVYEHVPNWRTAISEVYRVLRPGGVYAFLEASVPDHALMFNRYFGHVSIPAGELLRALLDNGFTIERLDPVAFRRWYLRVRKP